MRALHEQWDQKMSESEVERTQELSELRRRLVRSQTRKLVLEGVPGSGKTTLASQYARAFADEYPGGIEYCTGTGEPDRVLKTKTDNLPRLLVFDGLDEVWPGREWALGHLEDAAEHDPKLHVLIVSRPIPETGKYDRLQIGPMSDDRIAEIIRRQAGLQGLPPTELISLAGGNALLASLLGGLAQTYASPAEMIESLSSFSQSGLVDTSGRPVNTKTRSGRTFITDVREINDQILRVVSRDPEIVFQLEPRRFEELSAEMFERLGYSVTLTPAQKDGGKDLIIAKRDDLGTMLSFVECKRYAPDRPVGVGVVRALSGVVELGRATSGIVLTTSRFTTGAEMLREELEYRMSLKDFSDFKQLLQKCLN